ncbi:MAG TPA: HEAT repeat domain-containing protein [Methanoregulaceae archaeon]|nr:HEAT repeat domain-containing protein [Methanoregulaceae archaeon]
MSVPDQGRLKKALHNDDPEVRWIGVTELDAIPTRDAVSLLIEALNDEEFISIRWRSAIALGTRAYPEVVKALIAALSDENDHVREEAAESLGKIGDPDAISALIKALDDNQRGVRLRAVKALEMMGDISITALQEVKGKGSSVFSKAVFDALEGIQEKKKR